MIITCTNCNTKFRVKTNDIGQNGRLVRCSQCDYEWLVERNSSCVSLELDAKLEQTDNGNPRESISQNDSLNNINLTIDDKMQDRLINLLNKEVRSISNPSFKNNDDKSFDYILSIIIIFLLLIVGFIIGMEGGDYIDKYFPDISNIYKKLGIY